MKTAINEAQEQCEVNPKEGDAESNPDDAKSNTRKGDDAEPNPDDAKSNTRKGDDAKSNPLPPIRDHPDFNDAVHILMPKDQNATLLKGQHHPSLAEITKMENLPYQEGIGPLMPAPMGTNLKTPPTTTMTTTMTAEFLEHSDAAFTTATDVTTPKRLEDLGGTHSTAAKCVFRDLKGTRPVIFGRKSENNHLQLFEGAGGASQYKKWGYIPMLDGRNVPWINPREQDLSTRSTKAEEDKISTAGRRIWPRGPLDPFGKYSHHPRSTNERASTERGGTGGNLTSSRPSRVSYITERGGGTGIPSRNDDNIFDNNLTTNQQCSPPYAVLPESLDRHTFDDNAAAHLTLLFWHPYWNSCNHQVTFPAITTSA
jgi:hypothetical protein